MTAIRPPWITKKDYYRTPFNFCNRWCEHCELISICKVYQENEKDRKRAIKEGKDPDSMEFAFEVVHKNLQKTFKLLYKGAKRWGIDMEKIEKNANDKDWNKAQDYHNDILYKTAVKLNKKIYDLLNKLEYVSVDPNTEILKRDAGIISWYNPLFVAKIARAFSSFEEMKRHVWRK